MFEKLNLVVISIIQPRIATGNQGRIFVHQANLYALLKSTSTCDSPEELAKIVRECPKNNSTLLAADVRRYSSCSHLLYYRRRRDPGLPFNGSNNAETIELLFQDHQNFEKVSELFIQQTRKA
jgi:hypothetical protein